MSLLGEISKNSEALRYHAKTAEIAGQNLAHINDESYARQRVLAREGVMYGSFGELQTSGLEAAGLDHARSELLDKRVVSELSETANLEARKEILDLLQGALGETITRNGINVGLDDLHDSDLAPGSLTRALNDFFNAFQELSASPDEPTIKQELFNKIETLVKRFNDAGNSLDSIEADLTETIKRSVADVNRILAQIHEVNKQVRRFELQDKGKAVTYRDRRQALLEELSQLMDFKTEQDLDQESGLPSGFLNLHVVGKNKEKVNLLDPNGPKEITNDWGQEIVVAAPINPLGESAKIRAKIDGNGNLGRVEVLDGGSLYDDSKNPLLISFLPPKPPEGLGLGNQQNPQVAENVLNNENGIDTGVDRGNEIAPITGGAQENTLSEPLQTKVAKGDVFYQGGTYYQALEDADKGVSINDPSKFMAITGAPNGYVEETVRQFSDLSTFKTGDQIYYEGKYLQATENISAVAEISADTNVTARTYLKGEVVQYDGVFYQADTNISKGTTISGMTTVPGEVSSDGFVVIGTSLPSTTNSIAETGAPYNKGDIVHDQDNNLFYLAVDDIPVGEVVNLASSDKFIRTNAYVDQSVKLLDRQVDELQFYDNEIYYDDSSNQYFYVVSGMDGENAITNPVDIASFNPSNEEWSSNFHIFTPKLVDQNDPMSGVVRKTFPTGYNLDNGSLQELNIGIAEAVIKNGEISTFNLINSGNSFPSSDAIFSNGVEIDLSSGSINGYQEARTIEMERFRTELNSLVSNFVGKINQIYNPDDEPGAYLFGFDAFLTRPVAGNNEVMEEEYGYYGVEGNGSMVLYRDEVEMTLPVAEKETFSIVNTTTILPEQFQNSGLPEIQIRGTGPFSIEFDDPNYGADHTFYASARRMQFVTTELDDKYPGDDNLLGTADDTRSLLIGYETIPFRLNEGDKAFILGDSFSFDAVPDNTWNLATSLKVDNDLTAEALKATHDFAEGANDIAFAISKLADDNEFVNQIATMNADIGNSLSDLTDNLEHQKSLESLLLDQRRTVSSVSIDEEVANLMRFQRSFQASSRVLNTLDKMLELVVLGLVK